MGRLGLKGCDIMYDVYRLQRKREQCCDKGSEIDNSDIVRLKKQIRKTEHLELDYVKFLMLLYNYDNSQPNTNEGGNESSAGFRYRPDEDEDEDEDGDGDGDRDEYDDEDDDPDYKKFLANVKPNGHSYVVKIDRKDGFPMFVEYEKEDLSDEEYENLRQRKQHDAGDGKDLGNVGSKEKESQPFSRTVNDDARSAVDNDAILAPFDPVSQNKKGLLSQKLNRGGNGAIKRRRKGETKNKSNKEQKTEKGRKSANISTKEEAADVDEDYSLLLEDFICKKWPPNFPFIRRWVKKQPLSKTVKKKKKKRLTSKKHSVKENNGSKKRDKDKKRKRSSKEQKKRKKRKSANVIDEEEAAGRKSANVIVKEEVAEVGEALFNGGQIIEHKAAEEDLQILDNDNGTFGKEGSSILMEGSSAKHFESVEDSLPRKPVHCDFWWKVKALVDRPYDKKEYRGLRKAVKSRKHTYRNMDLRKGVKFYSTGHMGKSYLDHYRDLRQKLKEVGEDNRKKLIILRGFFFWLQNLTQDGAFRPWTNPEWLALLDKSS